MIKGLNHVTISVSNLEKSFAFYREVLGLSPKLKWQKGAYFLNGNLWLAILVDKNIRAAPNPEYSHIAFDVDASNFEKFSKKIVASGAKIFKENKSEGCSLYFLDPDGYKLEIHTGDINSRLAHYKASDSDKYEFY